MVPVAGPGPISAATVPAVSRAARARPRAVRSLSLYLKTWLAPDGACWLTARRGPTGGDQGHGDVLDQDHVCGGVHSVNHGGFCHLDLIDGGIYQTWGHGDAQHLIEVLGSLRAGDPLPFVAVEAAAAYLAAFGAASAVCSLRRS